MAEGDPLNSVFPGEFNYGGGHVIEDLVAGNVIRTAPGRLRHGLLPLAQAGENILLHDLRDAMLFNPRNCYQNYNCAVNMSDKTIYTYMGVLRPRMANANYATSGQLSPLFNDPYYRTIGIGTRIFLGGTQGYVAWHGTQHHPNTPRGPSGVPTGGAGTLAVIGDLKECPRSGWWGRVSWDTGSPCYVGIGIPIPILDERMARFTAVKDEDLQTQIYDYSMDYPGGGEMKSLGEVTYKELRSGRIVLNGKEVATASMSSYYRATQIAETLKTWIEKGEFLLGEPQMLLPSVSPEPPEGRRRR